MDKDTTQTWLREVEELEAVVTFLLFLKIADEQAELPFNPDKSGSPLLQCFGCDAPRQLEALASAKASG